MIGHQMKNESNLPISAHSHMLFNIYILPNVIWSCESHEYTAIVNIYIFIFVKDPIAMKGDIGLLGLMVRLFPIMEIVASSIFMNVIIVNLVSEPILGGLLT